MRLAKALKLRPDVITTLQRECTAQQAVGLLWLLQGASSSIILLNALLQFVSILAERNRSTFQEPIREINSYLRKEVERLAEYRHEAPGQLHTSPSTPHPSSGTPLPEQADVDASSGEASPALAPIRVTHPATGDTGPFSSQGSVDKLKAAVSPVVTPAGPVSGPSGAPTLAQRLAASAARGGNPGQPGPSPSPMAFAQALGGKTATGGAQALPQGVWVKKSGRSKGLKPLQGGAAKRTAPKEEAPPTPTEQGLQGGAVLQHMGREDAWEHTSEHISTADASEEEGAFAHAEGGLPPSTAEMSFQLPVTGTVLSSLGLGTTSSQVPEVGFSSLGGGVSGGLSSQSSVVGSGAMLGLGSSIPLGALGSMGAGAGGMDMWGGGAGGSSLGMPPSSSGLGGDVPAGLLSGLESVLASPPRVTGSVRAMEDAPPTAVADLDAPQAASAGLPLPGAEGRSVASEAADAPQASALAMTPLLPRTLDFSSPAMGVQGGSNPGEAKVTAPGSGSLLQQVASSVREWTRLARGGQGAGGQQLPPPLLCSGSDAAVTIALAVAMEDADEVVSTAVRLCPGGGAHNAAVAFGTPLDALAGHTPLTFLALHCELDGVAGMLLSEFAGAINTPAAFGWTPLQCAALACVLRATRGEPISARAFKGIAALLAAGAGPAQLGMQALPTTAAKVLHL